KCSKNSHEQFAKLRDGDQVDWANSQSGGHVLTTGNIYKKGIFRFRKRPMNTFISPITAVGDCYAFQPSNGYVVLGMRSPIFPTTFVYESVNADANPSSGSMPKTVKVSAVDENERLVDLSPDGNAFALKESEIRQSFELKRMEKAVKRIRVDFVENNGNKDFTCVYRIRVFGERK
ncbi:Secreted beta-glucosidase sun1, partial [Bonamia ostreae]